METLDELRSSAKHILTSNILPYWMSRMVDPRGGFYGRIDGNDVVHPEEPKGAILNARILWTFSAAYRVLGDPAYLEMATRAKRAILDDFLDPDYGGVYWSIHPDGTPLDTKKQIYAIGFAIYGLSEYARATGDEEALSHAVKLFFDIENHSFDPEKDGYFEAFTREWNDIADMRLSDKDANERKTMNTHLHILEPYTNLYRVWPDERLGAQIRGLIDVFLTKILDPQTYHLRLFFDDDWHSKVDANSYGHNIEASWLLYEAAEVLGDEELMTRVLAYSHLIADHADVLDPQTGRCEDIFGTPHQWWEYAESVVGNFNIWQHLGDKFALDRALAAKAYIGTFLIDWKHGEWYWSAGTPDEPFVPNRVDDKAGFWKCPYHNGRMCMELIERIDSILFSDGL